MMAKVYQVIFGELPEEPAAITATTEVAVANCLNAMWTQYNVCLTTYNHLQSKFNKKQSSWDDASSQAMGILNRAIDAGIWDKIKGKNAKESWDWFKLKYAKQSFLQLMEHFHIMKDQKINLSDPNPQLALFMPLPGPSKLHDMLCNGLHHPSLQPLADH